MNKLEQLEGYIFLFVSFCFDESFFQIKYSNLGAYSDNYLYLCFGFLRFLLWRTSFVYLFVFFLVSFVRVVGLLHIQPWNYDK